MAHNERGADVPSSGAKEEKPSVGRTIRAAIAVVGTEPFVQIGRDQKISTVNSTSSPPLLPSARATPRGRPVPILLSSIVILTLLFTAQDAMRPGPAGTPMDWWRSIRINALDWGMWGMLALVIVSIGRHHRLDGATHRARRFVVWALLGAGSCLIQSTVTGVVLYRSGLVAFPASFAGHPPPLDRYLSNWVRSTSGFNFIIFLMIVGAFHAMLYYQDLRARQLREADLTARLAHAELNVLRMQLQPHFFFNALHTVSSLMMTDVPTAHRVVTALGDLLRSSLDHTARQEIPLRDELTFVSRYLEIQKARFRNRIGVEVDIDSDMMDALVPSLVLQPLVENAIRHGIEPNTRGGTIWIIARNGAGRLILTVRDDGSAELGQSGPQRPTSGIGLQNIERRLEQLYGPSHAFRAGRTTAGAFEVTLELPLHTDPALFPAAPHAS